MMFAFFLSTMAGFVWCGKCGRVPRIVHSVVIGSVRNELRRSSVSVVEDDPRRDES